MSLDKGVEVGHFVISEVEEGDHYCCLHEKLDVKIRLNIARELASLWLGDNSGLFWTWRKKRERINTPCLQTGAPMEAPQPDEARDLHVALFASKRADRNIWDPRACMGLQECDSIFLCFLLAIHNFREKFKQATHAALTCCLLSDMLLTWTSHGCFHSQRYCRVRRHVYPGSQDICSLLKNYSTIWWQLFLME